MYGLNSFSVFMRKTNLIDHEIDLVATDTYNLTKLLLRVLLILIPPSLVSIQGRIQDF